MALLLRRKGKDDIPDDAVQLTREQAVYYQLSIVRNWPTANEVFMLKYGTGFLVGVTAISTFFINKHFRYKLKVGHYGRGSSYVAVIGTPSMISGLIHYTFIQPKVLITEYDCPACLQTRAGFLQATIATIWPFILAPATSFMYATRHFTYRLPSLTEKPKEILSLYVKFTKSAKNMGLALVALNMLAGMAVTSMEISEHANITKTMLEHDRRVDDGALPLDVDMRFGSEHQMNI